MVASEFLRDRCRARSDNQGALEPSMIAKEFLEMSVVDRQDRPAIARTDLSRPVALMLDDGLLKPEATFFDYGCGRGGDLHRLALLGYDVEGWDPAYRPDGELRPSDIVNLGYVINVIEDPSERAQALARAWALTLSVLVVAARPDWEARSVSGHPCGDGILTAKGTFQRFYAQQELRALIDDVLGVRSIAAAPGVFYVFRDEVLAQAFLATRVRRRPLPRPRGPAFDVRA